MRMDKFTTKFRMPLADAHSLAIGKDHQFSDPLPLAVDLLDKQGGVRLLLPLFPSTTMRDIDRVRRCSPTVCCRRPRRFVGCRMVKV